MEPHADDARVTVARTLAVDGVTAATARALSDAGVPAILLKGPTLAAWLYADGVRPYADSDLLVPLAAATRARQVLTDLGFVEASDRRPSDLSRPWVRAADHAVVDLHVSLHGATEAPPRVWDVLSEHAEPIVVGGQSLHGLDVPARALHVVLHAQQHADREQGQAREDLRRALEATTSHQWRQAASLALRLGAVRGFATGLRLDPAGVEVARGLPVAADADRPLALARHAVADAGDLRTALATAVRTIVPAPSTMRWRLRDREIGRFGLAAAYARRLARVVRPGGRDGA